MKNKYNTTNEMKAAAQRGLDLRSKYNRGGTAVGIARARDIVNDKLLPIETVARMYSFFKRHEVDKQANGWKESDDKYPSNGLIAWLLWGGDPGFKWSTRIWEKYKEENKSIINYEHIFNNIKDTDDDLLIKLLLNTVSKNNEN